MFTANDGKSKSLPFCGQGISGFRQQTGLIPAAKWAIDFFPDYRMLPGMRCFDGSNGALQKHDGPSLSRIVVNVKDDRVADLQW
jgi:hypothetical protein